MVSAGDPIGFHMTVFNTGAGVATGVMLSDTLPSDPGLSWVLADTGTGWGSTCGINGPLLTCGGQQGVTVPANTTEGASTFTVHVTSTTTKDTAGDCPGTGTVDNTGHVTTSNAGNDDFVRVGCVEPAQIHIAKVANPVGPVLAGDTVNFDITVSNAGLGTAAGVHVTDVLPTDAGTSWSLGPITGPDAAGVSCSISVSLPLTLTCDKASLPHNGRSASALPVRRRPRRLARARWTTRPRSPPRMTAATRPAPRSRS